MGDSFRCNIASAYNDAIHTITKGGVVTENSKVGTVVGVFLATDEDINQRLSYFLLPNDFFTVVGDELVVDGAIDFERTPYLTVEVLAIDDGTPPASVSVLAAAGMCANSQVKHNFLIIVLIIYPTNLRSDNYIKTFL